MRSLAARGFSFSKLRRLSTTDVDAKKSAKRVANEESSESRTLNILQSVHMDPAEEEDEVDASQVATDEVDSHFDTDYLQHRQNLLAYGKQMKRSDEPSSLQGSLALATQDHDTCAPQIDARASKSLPKTSMKPPRPQSSWVAKVMRDSGSRREQSGSKSQRLLLHSASS